MATTTIHAIKQTVGGVIDYCCNDKKEPLLKEWAVEYYR